MNRHIYVIGSNSFSGSHFARYALEKGFYVTGISRSAEADSVFLPYYDECNKRSARFSFLQADINYDIDAIISRIFEDKPSYIINFAAQGMVAESWIYPEQYLRTNALSPLILYDRLKKVKWLKKFVQISTPEVYGNTEGILKETTIYNPSTPYAVSKATADMNLMCFFRAYGFPVVFTRAANVYGPCQHLYRIIPRTILRFLSNETIELHGGGKSIRSFIHIKDVCDATWKVMISAAPGEIFHISNSDTLSIKDLVLYIADILHINSEKYIINVKDRLGKDSAYFLDSSKIRQVMQWQPSYTLREGIIEVISWIKQNFVFLHQMPQNYIHKV